MGTLLSAYEDFPDYFTGLQTHIPESNNQLPDLLDELLYNLRWMLTMQDPNDGGVYHKCTNAAFDGQVMPDVTKLPRYVVQKSTAASLDFAAVMAQSARIFQQFPSALPGLSDSCLNAAVYAWKWATLHPGIAYDQSAINASFALPITTGAYGDHFFTDERFWAATELFTTTGKDEYVAAINAYPLHQLQLASWSNVGMLGCYTLMRRYRSAGVKSQNIPYDLIREQLLRFADDLITNGGNRAFQTIMGQSRKDYIWGSNAVALNQSIALINAYMISDSATYLRAALSNLDYVLGRNATGYCFVTGAGSRSPLHIHHRPSRADGIAAPVPGLLAGGPNPGMQDKVPYPFTDPETAYIDDEKAYASNEIAINWNAPLVYVSAAFEALQRKAALSRK
jgi:endoglucanase